MKCKCGVELFDKDIVLTDLEYGYVVPKKDRLCDSDGRDIRATLHVYRCPKCFKTKKVKINPLFCPENS